MISKFSRGTSTSSTANMVDDCCNDGEIPCIFSSKFKSLLNSCPDPQSRNSLYNSIRECVSPSDLSYIFITQEIVRDAMLQLKSGKHDGSMFMSDHFIYAKDALSAPLSLLFTAMLRHGIVPDSLCDCILVPILKPGKDPSSSDSYHPIAFAPTLSKVFELCLLFQFQSCFITFSLQFGFKPGFSADLCTGLFKNVIHNYLESDSHVYGCFLDVSKAFIVLIMLFYSRNFIIVTSHLLSPDFSLGTSLNSQKLEGPIPSLNPLIFPMEYVKVVCYCRYCSRYT